MIVFLSIVIFLCISSIDCLNCSDVIPDGHYDGLTIYKLFRNSTEENWMFNRHRNKWRFTVSLDDNEELTIHSIDNSSTIEDNIDNQFGLYYRFIDDNSTYGNAIQCRIEKHLVEFNLKCRYQNTELTSGAILADNYNSTKFNFTTESLILKPFPSQVNYPNGSYVLAINRDNRTERLKISFTSDFEIETDICDQQCPNILFIEQMDDKLFRQLDSTVVYRKDNISGHLLLFNINERPFYCYQPEGQLLSRQV